MLKTSLSAAHSWNWVLSSLRPPGAYAPGGNPVMESALTTHQLSEELDQQRGARHLDQYDSIELLY